MKWGTNLVSDKNSKILRKFHTWYLYPFLMMEAKVKSGDFVGRKASEKSSRVDDIVALLRNSSYSNAFEIKKQWHFAKKKNKRKNTKCRITHEQKGYWYFELSLASSRLELARDRDKSLTTYPLGRYCQCATCLRCRIRKTPRTTPTRQNSRAHRRHPQYHEYFFFLPDFRPP